MQPQAGSKVQVHGLVHKPELNGKHGTCIQWDADLSAWEVNFESGTALVKPENLEVVKAEQTEHNREHFARTAWTVELFGHELKTPEGLRKTQELLADKRAVLIYFCDKWCAPISALNNSYVNYGKPDLEVVFVYSDTHRSPGDMEEFCADMPWPVFVGDEAAQDRIMQHFDITFTPFLKVLSGTGDVACRNGKNDVESRADFETLLSRWQL
mmetsp:Transcript_86989/g.153817  ORF Transcript_86989/g.153817 Transcript_86989/m.153817 type:complete len:212 (+) Transcript_86989:80-715(+)|eukprot:CAMPEP_0197627724 /NCGR_PEP_ID=MMETSP1338-20131121/6260_1 /TAXON_ID=43686 ORGANISM="Pelagodinium beii, Strain RCC1491" /NCGR_SAMPLE_ID=MMETSP1338 /ASSEMBLY_ACC=CAM_ASM_000754 /LENGTH=211 /DNA_ID=CAMNT_0043198525 /DNA_START=80 /DNA_END=715 /DNA_ORIENTATION=-